MADGVASTLVDLGVATLHEAAGRRGLVHGISLRVGGPFAGPAVTVSLPAGDNLGVHLAVEEASPGSVVCIASAGQGAYGVLGELLFEFARRRGVAGLVIDDGIRDVAELDPPPGLAARNIVAQGTVKARLRQPVGAAVALGGVLVESGDWIVCDRDGLVVLPAVGLDGLVAAAGTRMEKEARIRAELRRGRTTRDLLGLEESQARYSGAL